MSVRTAGLKLFTAGALLSLTLVAVFVSTAQDESTPYLGITFRPNADDMAQVASVVSDSPADAAGLQEGDIVTRVDDTDVTALTLAEVINSYAVGDTVTLGVLRDGEALTLEATLAARPETLQAPTIRITPRMMQTGAYLGVTLDDTDNGVTITSVAADSPAAEAGLEADDIITALDGEPVETAAAVVAAVQSRAPGDTLALTVERNNEPVEITATLGERSAVTFGLGPMRGAMLADMALYIADDQTWHVVSVNENGELYAAGLRAGDMITAIDGAARDPKTLADYLAGLDGDASVTLTVTRDNEDIEIATSAAALAGLASFDVRMGQMPFFGDRRGQRGMPSIPDHMPFMEQMRGGVRLGVSFQTLTAAIAAENGLDVTEGALIIEVADASPAADAGLQPGDVVTAVDGDAVDAQRTLAERLYAYDPGDTVTLTVLRDGETLEISAVLGQFEGFHGSFGMPFFRDDSGRGMFGPDGLFRRMIPSIPEPEIIPQPEAGANL